MIHYMKLQPQPFNSIKNKSKMVEMRLNDEKRKPIKAGDQIEFVNLDSGEKLRVDVVDKWVFENFEAVYERFDKIQLGYTAEEIATPDDMLTYYSKEEIKKYGVAAIIIK